MISRHEAAKLLDVSCQTVSNWVEKGILAGHLIDGRLYVDRNTIEQVFDDARQLGRTTDSIRVLLSEIAVKEKVLDSTLQDITLAQASIATGLPRWILVKIFSAIIHVAGEEVLTDRESSLLLELLHGSTISFLSIKYGLSRARIIQLVNKAFHKLYCLCSFSDLRKECQALRCENEYLSRQAATLLSSLYRSNGDSTTLSDDCMAAIASYGCPLDIRSMQQLLATPVSYFALSVRTLSCLKRCGIDTIHELLHFPKTDMLKIRNFGKKSQLELDTFITSLGLSWE